MRGGQHRHHDPGQDPDDGSRERGDLLIGADGTVVRVWRKVKVPGHAAEVLKAVKS